ncbi:MAG: hypothetical protein SPL86_01960 [Succiniclasticum sp.]|uniref:hypothetical protein n=1 Tax=Succiniclasticum sp. TaxID=2775030 RepID=UPI002A911EAA|nr:hypothetical protein [Succiniclasticum sp.]MDY6290229.1 hypothetical protein [Succiniclasticum sp.]
MKKLFLLTIMMLMLTLPAQARIIVETDNLSDTINYRTYKNVGNYGITEYSFIKSVDSDEKERYFLRLEINFTNHSSAAPRYLVEKEADFTIDGTTIKVPKAVNMTVPRTFQRVNLYDFCYYSLPTECIQAIAGAKNSVSFTIFVPNRKPDVITINEDKLAEIKNIILNGHFSNYLEDLNKK